MRSLVLAAVVLAALSPSAHAADPAFNQPAVLSCHNYPFGALNDKSETRAAVDCAAAHRAITVAVERLPAGTGYGSFNGVRSAVGTACSRGLASALGGSVQSRAASAYDYVLFIPTKEERDQGARWVRCDLVLFGGNALLPLPSPLLSEPLPASLLRCQKGKAARITTCDRPHDYRQTGVLVLSGKYPGQRALNRLAKRRYRSRATASRYSWEYSRRETWRAGEKRIVCFEKSKA